MTVAALAVEPAPASGEVPPLSLIERESLRPVVGAGVVKAAAAAAGIDVEVMERAIDLALVGGPAVGWSARAACAGMDADRFYPQDGSGINKLKAVCRNSCPVQAECLAAAISGGERHGLWGGASSGGRARMRRELRSGGLFGVVGEAAYVSWQEEGAEREPLPRPLRVVGAGERAQPWPHQVDAVGAVCAAIGSGGRCRITIAPAGGKTLIGLWCAESLGAARVLVQLPSLSLVGQTIEEWRAHGTWAEAEFLAVCSDTDSELELETTTDVERIRSFVADATPGRPRIVVATYQSSPVLSAAGVKFDLAVSDEAHHLAGARAKMFAAVVRGEIRADRILFMSATPRRYRQAGHELEVVGMDDEASFGPEVYRLQLAEAIEAGIVADYRVVVAAVDRATFDRVAAQIQLSGLDPQLLAGAIAVVQAMAEFGLGSVLSFHSRVERARVFARLVGSVAEALPITDRPPGPGWSGWAHGGTPVGIRQRLLSRLADPATWGVMANAQAFGEGVNLPSLESIAIVDTKNSENSVMQAVGRALRRPGGSNKVGTVLLPVLISGETDQSNPLAGVDPAGLEVVAGVLRALRAHDTALGARMDVTRRAVGRGALAGAGQRGARVATTPTEAAALRRHKAARGLLQSRVELRVPGGATSELAGAMALYLIRETTPAWEEALGRLRAWVDEHGHARVPQPAIVPDETGTFSLGAWCSVQRTLRRRGLLASEREQALEAMPGWRWDPVEEQWWDNFDALVDWARCEGGGRPSCPQSTEWRGLKIGHWVNTVRTHRKDGVLVDPQRIAALEALPGWSWDPRSDAWWSHYESLARWTAEHGHASPSVGDGVDDFDLGRWVHKQRIAVRSGRLDEVRAARLRALPGWVDHEREAAWEQGYARLVAWAGDHDGAIPAQSVVLDDGYTVGCWVATQRERYRMGRLDPVRAVRLEMLSQWVWTPRVDTWPACFQRLRDFVGREGHAEVVTSHVEDGFALGSWVGTQRILFGRGTLAQTRVAALESLPGWSWNVPEERFRAGVAAVAAFLAREGHCDPPGSHVEAGVNLAPWIRRIRSLHHAGRLEADRQAQLEVLVGWRWEAPVRSPWEEALERLRRWVEQNGGYPAQKKAAADDGFGIGSWVNKQRCRRRAGQLSLDRQRRLEALKGWEWDPPRQTGRAKVPSLSCGVCGAAIPESDRECATYQLGWEGGDYVVAVCAGHSSQLDGILARLKGFVDVGQREAGRGRRKGRRR